MTTATARRIAAAHGFDVAHKPDGRLCLCLPYVSAAGQRGIALEPIPTLAALRRALGY